MAQIWRIASVMIAARWVMIKLKIQHIYYCLLLLLPGGSWFFAMVRRSQIVAKNKYIPTCLTVSTEGAVADINKYSHSVALFLPAQYLPALKLLFGVGSHQDQNRWDVPKCASGMSIKLMLPQKYVSPTRGQHNLYDVYMENNCEVFMDIAWSRIQRWYKRIICFNCFKSMSKVFIRW